MAKMLLDDIRKTVRRFENLSGRTPKAEALVFAQ
jgi:hypothetical protein